MRRGDPEHVRLDSIFFGIGTGHGAVEPGSGLPPGRPPHTTCTAAGLSKISSSPSAVWPLRDVTEPVRTGIRRVVHDGLLQVSRKQQAHAEVTARPIGPSAVLRIGPTPSSPARSPAANTAVDRRRSGRPGVTPRPSGPTRLGRRLESPADVPLFRAGVMECL